MVVGETFQAETMVIVTGFHHHIDELIWSSDSFQKHLKFF